MKSFVLILLFFSLILAPVFVSANCSQTGATVIFINGIFGTEDSARSDKERLQEKFLKSNRGANITFINGFNPSHVGKLEDLATSILQAYGVGGMDYDLTNILLQAHVDLQTQKILLVGHSQGTFYTNIAYDYLTKHGVDESSIAVYNVGTPASSVAGKGKYLTSSTDEIVNTLIRELAKVGSANSPLPANIDIKIPKDMPQSVSQSGHSFNAVYLGLAPDRIVGDMDSQINKLSANSTKTECFIAPKTDVIYKMQGGVYYVADIMGEKQNWLTSPTSSQLGSITNAILNFGKSIISNVVQALNQNNSPAALSQALTQNNPAPAPDLPKTSPTGNSLSQQDQQDNLQETNDLLHPQNPPVLPPSQFATLPAPVVTPPAVTPPVVLPANIIATTSQTFTNVGGGGGGPVIVYPKILISEVEVAGANDEKQEFVELYNPNSQEVDLTNWYLQRKTAGSSSWATYASNNLFSGKTIYANGYFLIARTGYFAGQADIFTDNSITADNSFALKNPNGEISDKLGFGNAQDPQGLATINPSAGQTIGRKVLLDGTEENSDNNVNDFELQTPTPKTKNITYIAPIVPPVIPPVVPVAPTATILINEIQISGATDESQEFVELYNPNSVDVDLTGWYLQRKTQNGADFSTYAPNTLFSAKIIKANDYFLIARSGSSFATIADIVTTYSLGDYSSVGGSTLVLKRSDESISDKVGFGQVTDFEGTGPALIPPKGQSVGRKAIGLDTDNNASDFIIFSLPTPRESFMQTKIQDNTDYSASFAYDYSSKVYNYTLSLAWQSQSPNLSYFNLQYKINDGQWKDWLVKTTTVSGTFVAAYDMLGLKNIYSFRVMSQDASGNQSDWKQIDIDLSVPVVINEFAPFGTSNSTTDIWIELYNRSDADVNLTGWKLKTDKASITLSGTIKSHDYFILEKGSTNVISDDSIRADQVQKFSVSVASYIRGDSLVLQDAKQRYIDHLFAYGSGYGWTPSDFVFDGKTHTMERVSLFALGADYQNWQVNANAVSTAKDKKGNFVYGTPAAQNTNYQLYTFLPQGFTRDTTLTKDLSPYLCPDNFQVFQGITLTIEPGVVIKFFDSDGGIKIDGSLKAVGTDADKIIFTSFRDDNYAGDTNGDGNASSPGAGDWKWLYFTGTSFGNDLENVILKYGGHTLKNPKGALIADSSTITIKNSVFDTNLQAALFLQNSTAIIDSNQFLNNNINSANAIEILSGTSQITNNDFENNYFPIFFQDINNMNLSGNKVSGNNYNAFKISGAVNANVTLTADVPFLFDGSLSVPQGVILTISPGTVLQFNSGQGINVSGTLNAVGTTAAPIIFESGSSAPTPGSWTGLSFASTSQNSDLENIQISYAGPAIKADNCNITLKNSTISDSTNSGLWLVNSNSTIDTVSFANHTTGSPATAVYIQGGSPTIENSTFNNQTYGIYADSASTPNLENDIFSGSITADIFTAP